ncbi:MAG: hypothetical protein ACK5LV_10465 [Lachnospirales bacterium]
MENEDKKSNNDNYEAYILDLLQRQVDYEEMIVNREIDKWKFGFYKNMYQKFIDKNLDENLFIELTEIDKNLLNDIKFFLKTQSEY